MFGFATLRVAGGGGYEGGGIRGAGGRGVAGSGSLQQRMSGVEGV
jgi:hypothetical protein